MTLYTFTNISRNNSRLQISVLKNKNRTEECTFFLWRTGVITPKT